MLQRHVKLALVLSAALFAQAAAVAGELTLFSSEGLRGRELNLRENVGNLTQMGFNDRAESMVIYAGRWEICEHADFRGQCRVFGPGEYHSLAQLGNAISSLREVDGGRGNWREDRRDDRREERREERHDERINDRIGGGQPGMVMAAPVILFGGTGMRGRSLPLHRDISNLTDLRFNDQAESMTIQQGTWEFCEHNDFRGKCRVFGPGQYDRLDRDFHRSITSVRQVRGGGGGDGGHGRRDGVELFDAPGFHGQRVGVRDEVRNFNEISFNDRAGSLIVYRGQWEFCEHADFRGQCLVYGPGRYDRLGRMHNLISSIRRVQ
jgi:hypothetical protein